MNNQWRKAVVASTRIDAHGMCLTRESLENIEKKSMTSKYTQRININHNITIPPIGKVVRSKVKKCPDGEYELESEMEYFVKTKKKKILNKNLIVAFMENTHPFIIERGVYESDKIIIKYDSVNFTKDNEHEFIEALDKNSKIDSKLLIRKSTIPPPEIIINIPMNIQVIICLNIGIDPDIAIKAGGTLALIGAMGKIGEKIGTTIGEKIAGKICDTFYSSVKKIVSNAKKYMLPHEKPIIYLLQMECGTHIEFVIENKKPNEIINAVKINNLKRVVKEVTKLSKSGENIESVQYILNDSNKWELNYMLTAEGNVIGTEKSFDRKFYEIRSMKKKKGNYNLKNEHSTRHPI